MTGIVSVQKKPLSLELQKLSDVEFKETHWLWYPYMPAGALSLLFGNGGIGKSYMTCAIAADISKGRALPGQQGSLPPQKVLMVSAEDDAGRIIKPRMEKLDANMDNIFVSDSNFILDEKGIGALEEAMKTVAATVVFLDPLVSYLGGKMDINKSNETRAMMGPLAQAAANTGCAVVVVHHVRKDAKGKMIHQALGSADFGNSVRSAMLVAESKGGTRFMNHVKHNWSPRGPALAYSIDGDVFQWEGEFMDEEVSQVNTTPRARDEARDWLQELLRDGPVPALDVYYLADQAKIAKKTLERGKRSIALSKKQDGIWVWALTDREGMGDVVQYDRGTGRGNMAQVEVKPELPVRQRLVEARASKETGAELPEPSQVRVDDSIRVDTRHDPNTGGVNPTVLANALAILAKKQGK